MIVLDGKHVLTGRCIVLWDALTQPQLNDAGNMKHYLEAAFEANSPEYAELYGLVQAHSQATGISVEGEKSPFKQLDPTKFADLPGGPANYVKFSAGTARGCPEVRRNNIKQTLQGYQNSFYAGAVVQLLIHVYDWTNPKTKAKGISLGLSAVVILDDTVPKLAIAGGLSKSDLDQALAGGQASTAATGNTGTTPPPPGGNGTTPPPPGNTTTPANNGPQMTPKANGQTYDQFIASGWTEAQLIAEGMMVANQPESNLASGPTPPPPGNTGTPPPPAGNGGPQMTPKANGTTYDQFIASGWNDADLRAQGYMV